MNAKEYYKTISEATHTIFEVSVNHCNFLGKLYDYSASIQEWMDVIPSSQEKQMIDYSLEQVEFSCLSLLSGMYRQSFASLRLSLELLFGSVYFSAYRLEYLEWKNGSRDLKWQTINDENNGVLSQRFSNVFFPELSTHINAHRNTANSVYRELSEFVHGNYSTWNREKPSLSVNENLIEQYRQRFQLISSTCHFLLSMRYLKEIEPQRLHKIEVHVMDELQYIPEIRLFFGGAVEGK
ncbi:MAG: hypothetical protein V7L29_25710 [Nostoc sp.]|uniref:hypothetical protein n=1 Tax=Nostoc sp. TaxID=1180 RepID=UPI002FF870D6